MADTNYGDVRPDNDIYTLLVIIGTVFLITGTVLVAARGQTLFGSWMPF
jgi:hypothetical protein